MRWLLVSSQHHPTHGGIGTYASLFCTAAVNHGWQVELITRPSTLIPKGVIAHQITTPDMEPSFAERLPALRAIERVRPYRYALWSLAVAEKLLQLKNTYDAVEFVDSQAEGYVSLTSNSVRRHIRNICNAVIVHAHTPMFVEEQINGADHLRFGRSIYHNWERGAIGMADGVITASNLLRNTLAPEQPSTVIPYPVVCEHAQHDTATTVQPNMLLVGTVQPRKGVHTWARSLNRVFVEHPTVIATLIGPDTPSATDGTSMIEFVRSLIHARFRDRFHWRGPLPHREVINAISKATAVVVPSVFDNEPFVVSEALCVGTPVIVSDKVGWIEHVPALPVFSADDHDALASIQIDALAQPEEARVIAATCKEQLLHCCDPVAHLERKKTFAQSLQPMQYRDSTDHAANDTLDSTRDFISSVEEAEVALHAASNAGS